jgi:phosphatidylglycerophosphate synthase
MHSGYSLEQIKKAYIQKKEWEKQFPINYFFVRPISFYITYVILKITTRAERIAYFGVLLGICGCFFLAYSFRWSVWPGIIFVALYSLSDAVDGNVARTTNDVTLWGIYLDGLIGTLIDTNYLFFLGIGLYLSGAGIADPFISSFLKEHAHYAPFVFGSLITIFKLWTFYFVNSYEIFQLRKEGVSPFTQAHAKKTIGTSRFSTKWYFLVFINLDSLNNQLLLLIISAVLKMEIWFLAFFTFYFFTKAVIYLLYYFDKTKKALAN